MQKAHLEGIEPPSLVLETTALPLSYRCENNGRVVPVFNHCKAFASPVGSTHLKSVLLTLAVIKIARKGLHLLQLAVSRSRIIALAPILPTVYTADDIVKCRLSGCHTIFRTYLGSGRFHSKG